MEGIKIPGADFTIEYDASRDRWVMTCSKHKNIEFANSVNYGSLIYIAFNLRCEKCIKEHQREILKRRCLL